MRLFRKKEEEDENPDLSERIELPGGVSYKKKGKTLRLCVHFKFNS